MILYRVFISVYTPLYIVFYFFPTQILESDLSSVEHSALSLLFMMLTVGFSLGAVLFIALNLVARVQPSLMAKFFYVSTALLFWILLNDYFLDLDLKGLENISSSPSFDSSWWVSIVTLLVGLFAAAIANRYKSFFTLMLLLFLITSITLSVHKFIVFNASLPDEKSSYIDLSLTEIQSGSLRSPNILQIMLDRIESTDILDLLQKKPELIDEFRGFQVFPYAFGSYQYTEPSLAALMRGSFISEDVFYNQWLEGSSDLLITRHLKEQGYRRILVSAWDMLEYGNSWDLEVKALKFRDYSPGYKELFDIFTNLLDFSVLRSFPFLLKIAIDEKYRGLLAPLIKTRKWDQIIRGRHFRSYKVFSEVNKSLSGLSKGSNYFFFHSYLSHSPYFRDENCKLNAEKEAHAEFNPYGFRQLVCSFKMVSEFVSQLKKEGIYDNSMIILHSDHGRLTQRRPFLMIKPPGVDKSELEIREEPMNLISLYSLIKRVSDKRGEFSTQDFEDFIDSEKHKKDIYEMIFYYGGEEPPYPRESYLLKDPFYESKIKSFLRIQKNLRER